MQQAGGPLANVQTTLVFIIDCPKIECEAGCTDLTTDFRRRPRIRFG